MTIYTPFTYIIGWSEHKKFYYGCRHGKNCHPSDLWESYFTSSNYVKEFRKIYGEPDIIKIHRTFNNGIDCVLFENSYLEKINAKDNPLFLNRSNGNKPNDGGCYWTEKSIRKAKKTWLKRYGVENPSQSPEIQEKKKETWLEKYGVDHPFKVPEIVDKCRRTKEDKNEEDRQEILNTIKTTNQNRYNVDWTFQAEEVKQKIKFTIIERYGVDNPSKRMKTCSHCGEYKNIQHEQKCKNNINRNVWDRNGDKNGRAKTFKLINTETGEFFIIKGTLKIFCKQHGISYSRLFKDKNSTYKWKK